jgi:hypothetical protein
MLSYLPHLIKPLKLIKPFKKPASHAHTKSTGSVYRTYVQDLLFCERLVLSVFEPQKTE